MRKQKIKIELHHRACGVVHVKSAGRTDAGQYLICLTSDGRERRLLIESRYWLDAPEKVRGVFDATFGPIYEKALRSMRKGERYDVAWRWRRGGNVRPVENDEPVELSGERVTSENAAVVASVERLADIEEIATLEETADLAALVLSRRGPIRLPQRARVVA